MRGKKEGVGGRKMLQREEAVPSGEPVLLAKKRRTFSLSRKGS